MTETKTKAAKSMIPGTLVVALALGLVISLANAQKGNAASPKKDTSVYAELTKAPKKAVARRNPLESDPRLTRLTIPLVSAAIVVDLVIITLATLNDFFPSSTP